MQAAAPTPTPEEQALVSFARSTLNLLTFWPALRIAVSQGWGGATGRTHLAEDLVDLFYTTAIESSSSTSTTTAATTLVPDQDDIEAVVLHVLSHEFSLTLEDGSEALIARDLVGLWRECIHRATTAPPYEEGMAERFEKAAEKALAEDRGRGYAAQREGLSEEESSGSEEDSDEEMEGVEEEESRAPKREEPVVDEEGFTMVPKKGRR